MRDAVQLAIWEWVGLLLAAVMLINTLVFNGFIPGLMSSTNQANIDMVPRLVLVSFYAFAYLIHFVYVWVCFFRLYTFVMLHACWAIVFEKGFAVPDNSIDCLQWLQGKSHKLTFRTLDVNVLGTTRLLKTYKNYVDDDNQTIERVYSSNLRDYQVSREVPRVESVNSATERDEKQSSIILDLCREQEACIANLEKVTGSALERIVANITIMLGICLAVGFSSWTRAQLGEAKDVQLGSYALLLSVGTGVGALLTSASSLNSMGDTARQILKIAEIIFGLQCHPESSLIRPQSNPSVGFTVVNGADSLQYRQINPGHVLRAMSAQHWLLSATFGPAYALLPSANLNAHDYHEMNFKVGGNMFKLDQRKGTIYRLQEAA
jgi:hypothetical protein